jgi:hypothetical protein
MMKRGALISVVLWVLPQLSAAESKSKLNISSMTANGQEVQKLSCQLADLGLFTGMTLVAAIAEQKQALDACAPNGAAFLITWTWDGKTTTHAQVVDSSNAKAAACVTGVFKKLTSTLSGDCRAIVLVGENGAAKQAARGLSDKNKLTDSP